MRNEQRSSTAEDEARNRQVMRDLAREIHSLRLAYVTSLFKLSKRNADGSITIAPANVSTFDEVTAVPFDELDDRDQCDVIADLTDVMPAVVNLARAQNMRSGSELLVGVGPTYAAWASVGPSRVNDAAAQLDSHEMAGLRQVLNLISDQPLVAQMLWQAGWIAAMDRVAGFAGHHGGTDLSALGDCFAVLVPDDDAVD